MIHVRSRFRSVLAAALLLAAAPSCSEITGGGEPLEPGEVLFEVEYVNFAWGAQWLGFHVDREGNVYRFRLDAPRPVERGEVFTEAELRAKYAQNRELLKTIPAAEVLDRYERVAAAADGELTERRYTCADAGGTRFSALVHDPVTSTYRRVLLRETGDVAQANRSAAARELYAWLKELDPRFAGDGGCDPFD